MISNEIAFFLKNMPWKITEDKSGNLWLKNYFDDKKMETTFEWSFFEPQKTHTFDLIRVSLGLLENNNWTYRQSR